MAMVSKPLREEVESEVLQGMQANVLCLRQVPSATNAVSRALLYALMINREIFEIGCKRLKV